MEVCDDSASPSANQEAGIRTSLGDSGSARARKISTLSPTFYDLLSLLILGSDNERKALLNRQSPSIVVNVVFVVVRRRNKCKSTLQSSPFVCFMFFISIGNDRRNRR
jgi:hypothetical protein